MKTVIIFIALVVFSCMMQHGVEAAISAWTEPAASGADVSAAATTTIAESVANGASTGVIIQATGVGTVTYATGSQPTAGKLTINSDSGLLTLAIGTFDFETETTYILEIEGTDDDDDSVGTATVTLSITDVNDEDPVFASAQYAATVPDASSEGATVTTITATDPDTVGTIAYSITAGNDNDHFTIDATTGAITVKAGATLAASTLAGYQLTVTAADGTNTDATAVVWIAVLTCGGVFVIASLITLLAALLTTML